MTHLLIHPANENLQPRTFSRDLFQSWRRGEEDEELDVLDLRACGVGGRREAGRRERERERVSAAPRFGSSGATDAEGASERTLRPQSSYRS